VLGVRTRHLGHGTESISAFLGVLLGPLVLEYIFYPDKRDKIYDSLSLLYQGLNAEDAGEIFRVLITYVLSATEVSPKEMEENVKHLPGGVETVRTTADVLREEGYGRGVLEGRIEGRIEGRLEGVLEGKVENAREMLLKALRMKFDLVKPSIVSNLQAIHSADVLENLFELSFKCSSLEEFSKYLTAATDN
jgi:hypothetical protein